MLRKWAEVIGGVISRQDLIGGKPDSSEKILGSKAVRGSKGGNRRPAGKEAISFAICEESEEGHLGGRSTAREPEEGLLTKGIIRRTATKEKKTLRPSDSVLIPRKRTGGQKGLRDLESEKRKR